MIDEHDTTRLSECVPLRELEYPHLMEIVRNAEAIDLDDGDSLIRGDDDSLYYLTSGYVALSGPVGKALDVDAESPRASLPLFDDRARHDHAQPRISSRVVRIDNGLVKSCLQAQSLGDSLGSYGVAESHLNDTEAALLEELYRTYSNGELDLPSMPEVATRMRESCNDPDVTLDKLARVAQMDPAVSGALVLAANSPLYAHAGNVNSVRDAVRRLGLTTTRDIATARSMANIFSARSSFLLERARSEWKRGISVSAIAWAIARQIGGVDPERALLAGLLCRVGVVPILGFIDAVEDEPGAAVTDAMLANLTTLVGVLVVNYWDMESDLIETIENAEQWDREHDGSIDCCDIVQIARLMQAMEEGRTDLPEPQSIPAFAHLGISSEDGVDTLKKETYEDIETLRSFLGN